MLFFTFVVFEWFLCIEYIVVGRILLVCAGYPWFPYLIRVCIFAYVIVKSLD